MLTRSATPGGPLSCLALLVPLLVACSPGTPATSAPAETRIAAPAEAGRKAYVDPVTGRLVAAPAAGSEETGPEDLDPHAGAYQVPSLRGGIKTEVRGRFSESLVATVEEDGAIVVKAVQGIDAGAPDPGTLGPERAAEVLPAQPPAGSAAALDETPADGSGEEDGDAR